MSLPRVRRIEIKDLYGTKFFAFEPGTLTILKGKNEAGKSSILGSILDILQGGHDPSIIRTGAKCGSLLMELSNDTTIAMKVTPRDTSRTIRNEDGEIIPRPAEFIKSLFAAWDPTQIVNADNDGMAALLAKVMPVEFAFSDPAVAASTKHVPVPSEPIDLKGLAAVEKAIREKRTGVNSAVDAQRKIEADIKQDLAALPSDGNCNPEELRKQRDGFEAKRRQLEQVIADEIVSHQEGCSRKIQSIDAQAEKQRQEARAEFETARSVALAESTPVIAKIDAAIGSANAKIESAVSIQAVRKRNEAKLAEANQKVRAGSLESSALTNLIGDLEELRRCRLKDLPIADLTIDDGVVKYKGIAWTNKAPNTAARIMLGFEICALLQEQGEPKIPFFICDGLVHLDDENLKILGESLKDAGYQAIGARIGSGPLELEVI